MKKIIFGILVLTLLAATSSSTARPTYAEEGDEYKEMYWSLMQDCPNVKGDVVAWYPEGYHWIYGYSPNQWGADVGLLPEPYLAKNSKWDCKDGGCLR